MLLDQLLPAFDAVRAEHRVVRGEPGAVYAAVRHADFMRTATESPAVRALFGLRTLGERLVVAVTRRPRPAAPPPPPSMRLADLTTTGEWALLGEDPPREVAFGAVGRFWAGETAWEEIEAGAFAGYDRPGRARIAASFTVRPEGGGRTLITYECRTAATDAASRRAFLRYWRVLSPFIGVVLRAQLRTVERELARAPAGPVRA